MKRMKTPTLLLALAATLAACADRADHGEAAAPTPIRARVVEAVRLENPVTVELQGTVIADRVADVSTRVMATVRAIHVDAGDTVAAGQLLLSIDPEAAQGSVAQARGALAQARAALALAERNNQRFQALAERDAASTLEVDMARAQFEQAKGAVEQAEGALATAGSVAADSRVTAPFAGRIRTRMVEVGDLASPGLPLLRVESDGGRRLLLSVAERLVADGALAVGSPVAVAIDARPELGTLDGSVVLMSPGADPASHTFRVEVALPSVPLATGTTGRGRLTIGARDSVMLPADAVLRHGGLELVAIVDPGGRTGTRVVTTGATAPDGTVEILSGLTGGERVAAGLGALPTAGTPVEEIVP